MIATQHMPAILGPEGERALQTLLSGPALIAFDFDGTLAPIVERPDDARMHPDLDARVRALGALAPLAIVSGRGLDDLRKRAGVGARYLVGNHGNDGLSGDPEAAARSLAVCRNWRQTLERSLGGPTGDPGIEIEDKGATLSIHYRRAGDPAGAAEQLTALIAALRPAPRVIGGKYLFNLLPPGAVTKFEALVWLAGQVGTQRVLFVGDDDTDEIVFEQAPAGWLTVRVEPGERSAAQYQLADQTQVAQLVERIIEAIEPAHGREQFLLQAQHPSSMITPAPNVLTDHDVYLFREGTHSRLYESLGCHLSEGGNGARFAVWAPDARSVSVIGDWNGWTPGADSLKQRADGSGIWEDFLPEVRPGQAYKYQVSSRTGGYVVDKADPYGFFSELPPATGSRAWPLEYEWRDADWMRDRAARNGLAAPMAVYEVHPGSWRRSNGEYLGYRELAHALAEYVNETGFTHVELMPITEHPFYGSWGYQTTGYFAPTARYGTPQDFMYFVDHLHRCGIGVILDWVPSHFPTDAHGLGYFDGTHLYEHADPRQGFHPEWGSAIFNYGRNEVRSFLLSSALFWLDRYHIDGLRVDAVASMLYLDYARKEGEWIPNRHGGKENLEAVEFLRVLNQAVYRDHPDAITIAEESTAWPMVSRPTDTGGLGFGMKWNMGWMHDTLAYMEEQPIHRKYHHNELTFSLVYAFNENFMLPLSHDEVVYGKGSLIDKMPGDNWQQFANLRALYGYMWTHPGKKLLFMGCEFGQRREWAHEGELDWGSLEASDHRGLQRFVKDLNAIYRSEPALHEVDFEPAGFEWIEGGDASLSVIAFLRKARAPGAAPLLVVCNFTPVPRRNYAVGVPGAGFWREIVNSDARDYGGSGWGNLGGVTAAPVPAHGRRHSLALSLPPLSVIVLKQEIHA